MTTLLPLSLQKSVYEIIDQSNLRGAAVRAILLSTTEGVPLGRVVVQSTDDDHPMKVDVLASIESVWAPASKQFPVLGLDKLKQVTAMYNHGTLIHIYQAPMVRLCSVLLGVGCGVLGVLVQTDHSTRLMTQNKSHLLLSFISSYLTRSGHHNTLRSAFQSWCGSFDGDTIIETGVGTIVTRVDQFPTTR